MAGFENWALSVTDEIEDKIGTKNVRSEVFEDHVVWTSRLNRGVARVDDDGRNIAVKFDHGRPNVYAPTIPAHDVATEIVGRLLGFGG